MSASIHEDIQLPDGPIVRVRTAGPADRESIELLQASDEATRIGAQASEGASEQHALVADLPWGGRIIGHAAWGRLTGPRAAAAITVSRGFTRWPVAAHLLVRLARVADAELIPTLVVTGAGDLEQVLIQGFGARRRPDRGFEISTREWPAALATLGHRSDAVVDAAAARRPMPAGDPGGSGPVVVVGGGVAALECVIALRDMVDPRVRIQLVAPDDSFVYRPLEVTEPFSLGRAWRLPLSRVAADFDVEIVTDIVAEVRSGERRVICGSGTVLEYGSLVLATGARRVRAFEHAITFGLDPHHGRLHGLLIDLGQGVCKDVAFVVPPDTSWSLPAYELALMTAHRLRDEGIDDVNLTLVTPESRPLAIFGPETGETVAGLLEAAGIEFVGSAHADVREGAIQVRPGGWTIEIDEAVALPALRGPAIPGLPADDAGFIPTDAFGAVAGLPGVFAAGDGTAFPIKQGGLAAQQADVVAQAVAARLGVAITPRPFEPVLRGLLFTADDDRFLRTAVGDEGDGTSAGAALWSPATKIAGLYLAPYLYADNGLRDRPAAPAE